MLDKRKRNSLKKNTVFVDTSAIAAILNKKDSNHRSANKIYKKLQKLNFYFILTNFVIAETHAIILLRTKNIEIATDWLTNSAYKDFNVCRPKKDVEIKAVKEINKYQDKDFSLTDMLSFLIMDKVGIQYYFAYDEHFEQIGKFSNVSIFFKSN